MMYAEKLEWPLINTFPDHIMHNPTAKVTLEDFKAHCHGSTGLLETLGPRTEGYLVQSPCVMTMLTL